MRPTVTCFLLGISVLCGGCATLLEGFAALRDRMAAPESTASQQTLEAYGVENDIRGTVDIIKTVGDVRLISSRAIRLPSNALSAITMFNYEFPDVCGGHQFRVYEADSMQILEYEYAPVAGRSYVIRDYISGPNPFIQAGLWTAYDHTSDSISKMSMRFARRGSGVLVGTYSQGPVTGLNLSARRTLGMAYDRALRDSHNCRG